LNTDPVSVLEHLPWPRGRLWILSAVLSQRKGTRTWTGTGSEDVKMIVEIFVFLGALLGSVGNPFDRVWPPTTPDDLLDDLLDDPLPIFP
jgi:hypothetical protein